MIIKITLTGNDRQMLCNLHEKSWMSFLFGTPANETDVEVNVSDSIITIRFVVEEHIENIPNRLSVTKDDGDITIRCTCFTGSVMGDETIKMSDLPYKPQPKDKGDDWWTGMTGTATSSGYKVVYDEQLPEVEYRKIIEALEARRRDAILRPREPMTYQEWLKEKEKQNRNRDIRNAAMFFNPLQVDLFKDREDDE